MRTEFVRLLLVAVAALILTPAATAQMSLSDPPPGANNFACRPSHAHLPQIVLNALDPRHSRAVSCAGLPPFAPPPA